MLSLTGQYGELQYKNNFHMKNAIYKVFCLWSEQFYQTYSGVGMPWTKICHRLLIKSTYFPEASYGNDNINYPVLPGPPH